MIDPTCNNCTYEVDRLDLNKSTGFCPNCQKAYRFGFENGIRDISFDDAWRRNETN